MASKASKLFLINYLNTSPEMPNPLARDYPYLLTDTAIKRHTSDIQANGR
ncbi:hypothetical protein C427_1773 [Paraglaciecola psychrophila 170]|uniref:Uncharacterized protein n=1 Tax=Paraglaciecola psychrophila 170 TaxID=1129794 RepID=K7A995_9ALTE|nr:hypothetical protein C427_1773 [Paraglaciecola psychrophila 170]GAC37288.1 hypothetical protein GPSY_1659 [Paraglaciecola psychrophila 170]